MVKPIDHDKVAMGSMNRFLVKKSEKENIVVSSVENVLPSTSSSCKVQRPVEIEENSIVAEPPPPNKKRVILQSGGNNVKKFILPDNSNIKLGYQNDGEFVELEETDSPYGSQDVPQQQQITSKKHTVMDSIRDTLVEHLGFEGNIDDFYSSEMFLALMRSLPAQGTCEVKKADGTMTKLEHEEKAVYIKWTKSKSTKDYHLFFTQKTNAHKKCMLCWWHSADFKNGLCRLHSKKEQEVLLIRDTKSATPVYSVGLPAFKMTKYDEVSVNKYLRDRQGHPKLKKHFRDHPDAWFEITKSWPVPTTSAIQKFNTVSTACFC
ncbi:uncharacterized protein LOC118435986 [Folsomia candida]|uniref:uncharacterized protein LOC118435986 n=1 Tax=Folsomia candida TaxID=158441 RepID=UPI001604EB7E|nr:uncharacterized protein LOC118435986 [Folsomia candida]